jgi:hypothetical protein
LLLHGRRHEYIVGGVLEHHILVELDVELVRVEMETAIVGLASKGYRRSLILGPSCGIALPSTTTSYN